MDKKLEEFLSVLVIGFFVFLLSFGFPNLSDGFKALAVVIWIAGTLGVLGLTKD